jgi:predicted nucleic acid-binding protein
MLDGARMAKARAQVRALREQWIEVQPSERVRDIAVLLLERHALTAADAMQLAAALVWANERPKSRVFVCLDRRLADAARKEGFEVAP